MKKDIEMKLSKTRMNRLKVMPDLVSDYIMSIQEKMTLRTQIAYIKDYTMFLEYLLSLPAFKEYEKIEEFKVSDMEVLEEKDIWQFLDYLTEYKKTFKGKNGDEYTQTFTNTKQGKARKLASLHSLFDYLARKHKIKDPTKFIEVKVNKKREIKDRLNNEEINRLMHVIINDVNIENERKKKFHQRIKYRDLNMLLILAFTGMRVTELIQLDISDINIQEEALIVTRKGGNQEKLYIPDEIIGHISDYIDKRKSIIALDNNNKDALFLSNQRKRINAKTVGYMLDKYAKRAEIPIKVTAHVLRRSFATELLDKTNNIELVANQLGHSSINTTRQFYADLSEEKKRQSLKDFKY
jgi:integrase/recombinase XerC